ncbi:C-type lectin domain-containing protein [archaeon]|nr:MAG: C-type lectin domain-containing protein [archaeon]
MVLEYIVEFDSQPANATGEKPAESFTQPPTVRPTPLPTSLSLYRYFQGHCYDVSTIEKTWNSSRISALNMGGVLGTQRRSRTSSTQCSLGCWHLSRLGIERCWYNLNKFCHVDSASEVIYSNWYFYQPDHSGEECVQMSHNMKGEWNDHYCDQTYGHVVEFNCKPPGASGLEPKSSPMGFTGAVVVR